jgi:hypothetical protein
MVSGSHLVTACCLGQRTALYTKIATISVVTVLVCPQHSTSFTDGSSGNRRGLVVALAVKCRAERQGRLLHHPTVMTAGLRLVLSGSESRG